ncbi:MAG: hypothetical protein ACR2KP_13695, partial [Egibacteraceae bacterium]
LSEYLDGSLERQQTQLQPGTWRSYHGIVEHYLDHPPCEVAVCGRVNSRHVAAHDPACRPGRHRLREAGRGDERGTR